MALCLMEYPLDANTLKQMRQGCKFGEVAVKLDIFLKPSGAFFYGVFVVLGHLCRLLGDKAHPRIVFELIEIANDKIPI